MPPITSFVEFDRIPVLGMLLETDGTVVAANQAMCHLLGKPVEAIVGQKLDTFTRKGNNIHTQNQQSSLVDELELDGPNGTCTIEVVMSIMALSDGSIRIATRCPSGVWQAATSAFHISLCTAMARACACQAASTSGRAA